MLSKNISCHFERSEKSRSGLCLRLARDPSSLRSVRMTTSRGKALLDNIYIIANIKAELADC